MSRTLARRLLAGSLGLVALAYAAAFLPGGVPAWAPWSLLVGSVAGLASISILGAGSRGSAPDRRLLGLLTLTSLLLVGSIGAGLLLPPPDVESTLVGGLPPAAALMVYGAGLLPLLLVPLGYAWVFPRVGFAEGELERVREEALRARAEARSDHEEAGNLPSEMRGTLEGPKHPRRRHP
jgi:hypothetical protein